MAWMLGVMGLVFFFLLEPSLFPLEGCLFKALSGLAKAHPQLLLLPCLTTAAAAPPSSTEDETRQEEEEDEEDEELGMNPLKIPPHFTLSLT